MAYLRLTEANAQETLNRTSRTAHSYKAKGCPGFIKRGGRIFFNPEEVRKWVGENNAGKSGPSARGAVKSKNFNKGDADALDRPGQFVDSIIDSALKTDLEAFKESLGDGPFENEIGLCKRLFGRLSELVLTWDGDRLLNPEDQSAFCTVAKTLAQVTSRVERMEGRLIDLRRRKGELLTKSEVMTLLRGLADDVTRGTDRIADQIVSHVQEFNEDIEADNLRARLIIAVAKWRDDLAKERRKKIRKTDSERKRA